MAGNSNLHAANRAKKDEFYTQLSDIANELKHYRQHFAGKTVLCNCDDPFESNFFKYFALNFNSLGLKKLICTCYDGSPVAHSQLCLFEPQEPYGKQHKTRVPHKIVITEVPDVNGDGAADLADVEWLLKNDKNILTTLLGNGDFRSAECIELLKQADIVVTNPPFSLFREYIAQLVEYDKKFLILGNINAAHYAEIFPLLKMNKLWWGISTNGSNRWMRVPDDYKITPSMKIVEGVKYCFVNGIMWYTNLDNNKRHEEIDLYKTYSPEEYPKYDNYDAIEVSRVESIPLNYEGIMGVPITFLNKYCPEQFEIVGIANHGCDNEYDLFAPKLKNKTIFTRILIRRKQ